RRQLRQSRGRDARARVGYAYRTPRPICSEAGLMSADRNLLFGILALQNNLITRDQLVEAMNAWTLTRHRPLGELLRESVALAEDEHALIEALVNKQLARHKGDAEKSLRGLEVSSSARRALAEVGDGEVQATVAGFATRSAEATTDHIPRPGGGGLRYRVL